MDRIIAVLSHPFTLLIRWNVWQRASIVLALFLLIVLVLWKVLRKTMRVALNILVKGFYLLFCEFLFHLVQNNTDWARVHSRNSLVARCEWLYNKIQMATEKHRGLKFGRFILLYVTVLVLIALPFFLKSDTPAAFMPVVSTVTNIYHRVEMPIMHQSMRIDPLVPVSASELNDVEQQNPYRESIQFVCSRGLLECSDGYFYPNDILTRENLAVMLYRYSGEPGTSFPSDISDVLPGVHSYSAVCWCVEEGILYPQADGSFTPDQLVTNEQFLVALARYANAEGFSTKVYFNMSTISGSADIHDWAMDACKWAAKMNILILDEDGYFLPEEPLSREKAAKLFSQFSVWESNLKK